MANQQRIVCAANRITYRTPQGNDGLVTIPSVRHFSQDMHGVLAVVQTEISDAAYSGEQGFLDNKGNFLTREEAWVVALAADQVLYRVGGDEGCLYTENLY